MKTPITYYGGKQKMVPVILPLIPDHEMYCEPFFGGGAVYFAKRKSEIEVINDLNGEAINFYSVTQKNFDELQTEIRTTLHSRELFRDAQLVYNHPHLFDKVKRAWAFWTLANQGFSSMVTSWGFGKDNSVEKKLFNKRNGFTEHFSQRLEQTQIESNDALKVIERCNYEKSFVYADPPYFNSDCGHYAGYTEADFENLLKKLASFKGKFLLSSYPSPLLSKYAKKYKWKMRTTEKKVSVTKLTQKRKIEVLTWNYEEPKVPMYVPGKDEVPDYLLNPSGILKEPPVLRRSKDEKDNIKVFAERARALARLLKEKEKG